MEVLNQVVVGDDRKLTDPELTTDIAVIATWRNIRGGLYGEARPHIQTGTNRKLVVEASSLPTLLHRHLSLSLSLSSSVFFFSLFLLRFSL